MSDITLFQSNNLPDYLKEVELDDLTKSLAGNTSVKRISIRGGVFRMVVGGEEVALAHVQRVRVVEPERAHEPPPHDRRLGGAPGVAGPVNDTGQEVGAEQSEYEECECGPVQEVRALSEPDHVRDDQPDAR